MLAYGYALNLLFDTWAILAVAVDKEDDVAMVVIHISRLRQWL